MEFKQLNNINNRQIYAVILIFKRSTTVINLHQLDRDITLKKFTVLVLLLVWVEVICLKSPHERHN